MTPPKRKHTVKAQPELPGMPKKSPLALEAESFLSLVEELKLVKEALEEQKEKLIAVFKESGAKDMFINRIRLVWDHKEKNSIKIMKQK